jgi:SsrA-binding protein
MPTLTQNRRAMHDYKILEKMEAGLVLTGAEVKSAKGGRVNLQGTYVIPKGGELWLTGMNIAAYLPAKGAEAIYDSLRDRKLLLKHKELSYLLGKIKEHGLTLVPLSVYTTHRFVKVELGLGKGKSSYDKRASIRKREVEREVKSSLKLR